MKRINGLICVYFMVLTSQAVYCDMIIDYPVNYVLASENMTVNLVTGGFVEVNLELNDFAHANILGGRIGVMGGNMASDLRVEDNSTATISGGETERVLLFDHGSVIMNGGVIGFPSSIAASLHENSSMVISGGSVNGRYIQVGAHPSWYESSVLTIAGPSLRVDGSPVSYGVFYDTDEKYIWSQLGTDYSVTGYLQSGDYISTVVHVFDDSKLVIIPEPCTLLLLGLGGLILRKLATKRREEDR